MSKLLDNDRKFILGEPKEVGAFEGMMVQITNVGTYELALEGSIDGSTWHAIDATITSNELLTPVTHPSLGLAWDKLRVRVTTAGNPASPPVVRFGGKRVLWS